MAEPKRISPKEEKFCVKYFECGIGTEAYKEVYKPKGNANVIRQQAHYMMKRPQVIKRMKELRDEHASQCGVSLEYITDVLEEILESAREKEDLSNMRQVLADMAKLHGLIVDKQELMGEVQINKERGRIASRFAKRFSKDEE